MEAAQGFIFDAGWIFFAAWGVILAAASAVTFLSDMEPLRARSGEICSIPAEENEL
jgi:hypothetical protein